MKRGAPNVGAGGAPKKPRGHVHRGKDGRNPSWWDKGVPEAQFAFKVLCTDGLAASMIGERGAVKEDISKKHGVKLVFSNRNDYYPGTQYRVMGIYSDGEENILGALEEVIARVVEVGNEERRSPPPGGPEHLGKEDGEFIFRFCVTRRMTNAIIGVGGANISQIRKDTGSKVFLENDTMIGHRLGRIIGQPSSISAALRQLNDIIQSESADEAYKPYIGLVNFGAKDPVAMEDVLREFGLEGKGGGLEAKGGKGGGGKGGGGGKSEFEPRLGPASNSNNVPVRGPTKFHHMGLPKWLQAEIEGLADDLNKFPPGAAEVPYLISHVTDLATVENLNADPEFGCYFQYVEDATETQIVANEEVDSDRRRVSITGLMPNIYTAQAMLHLRGRQLANGGALDEPDEDETSMDPEYLLARIAQLEEQLRRAGGA